MVYDPNLFEVVRVPGTCGLTVNWDEHKKTVIDLVAPGSSILCNPNITEISRTSASWHWKRIDKRTVRVWMQASGSGNMLDQWRGWVDLSYDLLCSKRRQGVPDDVEIECPTVNDPATGGSSPYEGEGVDTYCAVAPDGTEGVLVCIPYHIKDGKMITGAPYACGVCYKDNW